MQMKSQVNSDKGALMVSFNNKVKVNPKYQNNIKDKIVVFLNGTCEKYDLKYQITIMKDSQGWDTVKVNYQVDFNIPESSGCVRLYSFNAF